MIDTKELAENILTDLMNSRPLSDILLKMKILASVREDKELLDWVTKELNGYDGAPPKYRILTSALRIKVFVPYQGERWIEFHVEMIEDEKIRERLANMPFHQSIGEIESLCSNSDDKDGTIKMHVPVFAYRYISKFVRGDIQDAYQYLTAAAVLQIIVSVKSILIDFLLKVNEKEDINFNSFINNNQKMVDKSITINAGIINAGDGTVNAQGATTVVGDKNIIGEGNKEDLLKILAQIDELASSTQPNPDYEEISHEIKEELKKEAPEKKYLKRCFQAIPSFLANVGAGLVANNLPSLIASAIALL